MHIKADRIHWVNVSLLQIKLIRKCFIKIIIQLSSINITFVCKTIELQMTCLLICLMLIYIKNNIFTSILMFK